MIVIRNAEFPHDAEPVLSIWREYVASPSVSLDYQKNDAEFAHLPGRYGEPAGCILIAEVGGDLLGCIALRRVSRTICEMKRLYVRPTARGLGLGRKLATRLIEYARTVGYSEMRLDVLAEFKAAQHLYADLGFIPADPVSINPIPGTKFLGLKLN